MGRYKQYEVQCQQVWTSAIYRKEQEIKSATAYKSYDDPNIDDNEQVRDLGIMMSNTASFTLHIRNVVKKARDKMGWVLRVFQSRERSLMLTLLKSLVIPLLEYCYQLWNPWKAKDIQASETILRTFTYKIIEVQHLNYWERLHMNSNCILSRDAVNVI